MKYKTAKVVSHPRAGSHYLTQLLNINFFHKKNYLNLYAGHSRGHIAHLKSPNTVVFYIYRDNEPTIKSMFILRNRFGLVADNIEEFKTKKLSEMHTINIESEAVFNGKLITDVDSYFSNIHFTVEEYLNEHKSYWTERAHFVVKYEALIQNFQLCMEAIANHLESDRTEFIQEDQRIGWYDKNDLKKTFS